MTPLERLRLATALVHAVPGADLELCTDRQERIVVSRRPDADIEPCQMRRMVSAMACINRPELADHVADLTLGGELSDLGGGVFATCLGGHERRWLASLLGFPTLSGLLDEAGTETLPDNAMSASLKPDPALGVTVVAITSNAARFDHLLDDVTSRVAAACFVAELCGSVSDTVCEPGRIGGVS